MAMRYTIDTSFLLSLLAFLLITDSSSSDHPLRNNDKIITEVSPDCVGLECFSEWKAEEGYWIGEYSFYQNDGTPFESERWNYPYHKYKGFITGAVRCHKYRQRNVFLYPPQSKEICAATRNRSTIGVGICGVNGNSKVFFADQEQQDAARRNKDDGSIQGIYGGLYKTKTSLVGDGATVLYQVWDQNGDLHMNQLTTVTTVNESGMRRRVRSAQGFSPEGSPTCLSFYREHEVSREEFFTELQLTLLKYNILESDTCTWTEPGPIPTDYPAGLEGCVQHLNEAFEIKSEECGTASDNSDFPEHGGLSRAVGCLQTRTYLLINLAVTIVFVLLGWG